MTDLQRERHTSGQSATTFLFVPAHQQKKAAVAMASAAHAVIFDLEASVPDKEKDAARWGIDQYVRSLRTASSPEVWVRVNATGPQFDKDVDCIAWNEIAGVVVAQAESAEPLRVLEAAGVTRIIPLIESVCGFDQLGELSRVQSVCRFAIGTWDLALDLRLPAMSNPDESELIWRLRGDLVLASRRANLEPPVDGVHAQLDDEAGLRAVCERSIRLGYSGKLVIHPKQLAVVASAFRPDDAVLGRAREIVDAYDGAVRDGLGVTLVHGQMVDLPVALRARALLARWQSTALAIDTIG